jgi:putative transposase
VKFAFIAAEKAAFPVRVLCRILAVSRAGFYAGQARPSGGAHSPGPATRRRDRRRSRRDATALWQPPRARGAAGPGDGASAASAWRG